MFKLLLEIFSYGMYFFQGFCLKKLLDYFFLEKNKMTPLVIAGWGLFRSLYSMFISIQGEPVKHLLFIVISILGIWKGCDLLYGGEGKLKLYVGIVFMFVCELSFFVAFSIFSILSDQYTHLLLYGLKQKYITDLDFFNKVLEGGLNLILFVMYAGFSWTMYYILTKVKESYLYKDHKMEGRELLWMVTPGLAGLLLSIIIKADVIIQTKEGPELIYQKYPVMSIVIPAVAVLSLLSVIFTIRLSQNLISLGEEQKSALLLEQQLLSMSAHIREIETLYDGIRGIRHDMKNNIDIIRGLAGNPHLSYQERAEQIEAYLSGMNQAMEKLELTYCTGNPVTDVMLHEKSREALSLPGMDFQAEAFIFPPNLNISVFDVAIILSNGLDNAIEACKRFTEACPLQPLFIHVKSFQRGNMFFIEIENSFDGRLKLDGNAKLPLTLKETADFHGIGLKNIEKSAQKYFGTLQCIAGENSFLLSVMLEKKE